MFDLARVYITDEIYKGIANLLFEQLFITHSNDTQREKTKETVFRFNEVLYYRSSILLLASCIISFLNTNVYYINTFMYLRNGKIKCISIIDSLSI